MWQSATSKESLPCLRRKPEGATASRSQRRAFERRLEFPAHRRIVALTARWEFWARTFKRVLPGHVKRSEPIPVRRCRSGEPMKDQDKFVALIRLRDLLYY